MRFAYIADVPWWAIMRHGEGLRRYTDLQGGYSWDLWAISDDAGELHITHADLDAYDMIVYGGLPIWHASRERGWAPSKGRRSVVVTMASFRDAQGTAIGDVKTGAQVSIRGSLQDHRIAAIVINDRRMTPWVVDLELPIIVHPDRVDHEVFGFADSPLALFGASTQVWEEAKETKRSRRLRIGWAGSDLHWSKEKHLDAIREACQRYEDEVELVLQRREHEGLKTAEEMVAWYETLDAYICLNDELTPSPVPVLEAMAKGIPVLTTMCGETAPLIAAANPNLIMWHPLRVEADAAIARLLWVTDESLKSAGARLAWTAMKCMSWAMTSEADIFSHTLAQLADSVR